MEGANNVHHFKALTGVAAVVNNLIQNPDAYRDDSRGTSSATTKSVEYLRGKNGAGLGVHKTSCELLVNY
jgi:hypothetical protein